MIAGSIIHTYGCMCVKQSLCGMRRLMQPCKVKSVGVFVVVLTQQHLHSEVVCAPYNQKYSADKL